MMTSIKYSFAGLMLAAFFSNYAFAVAPVVEAAPVLASNSAASTTNMTSPVMENQKLAINNDVKVIEIQKQDDNAELAYQIDVSYPQLASSNLSPAAQQFNQLVLDKVNQSIQQFKYYVKADHKHMLTLPESIRHNTLQISYDLDVIAPNNRPIISLRLNIEGMQAGRAHPYHTHQVLNYDLTNGKVLTLSDLFKRRVSYLRALAKFCNQKLSNTLQDKWMIAEGTTAEPKNFKNWNLESDGLRITFEEYQVAPYAYGPQEVEIPYAALKNLLAANSVVMPCVKDSYSCILDN